MSEIRQGRNRFVKHIITKDVAAKIEDELRALETREPPPAPPKETYTFADVLRENFELLESIKNKRHKTEVILSIFRKYNLDITPASINTYMSRIRKELRKRKEALNGYLTVQNKQGGDKKTKAQITEETIISKNNPVNPTKEEITTVRNALHNEDVNTSVVDPCNSTINAGNAEQDNEPVKPLVAVQAKRKDNF